ncbi:MAG: radical SAM family heme chaperone HemW, partial [Deltaproteobacteria bacterium]
RQAFVESNPVEITIEINPGTITRNSLAAFRDAGINRLSIGIQSFNDKTLKSLGRVHSADNSPKCYEYARTTGFDNIGIDLIFGAPGQSVEEWEGDLKTAVALRPEHISAYNLTVEKGTLFFELQKNGGLVLPSEEGQVLMYELAIDSLKEAGYNHYEISNFSLTGFESQHNMRYWSCMDYIGLGAGAHSYISSPDWGIRWWNESDPDAYMQQINETGQAIAGKERLTKKEAIEEGIFLGLRRTSGINMNWFAARFNTQLKNLCRQKIAELKTCGLIYEDGSIIRLTRKGLILSNEVFAELI